MTNTFSMLALYMPSLEMWVMFIGAASLPAIFVIWMFRWLRSVREVNPEEMIRAQEKADEEHLAHHAPAAGRPPHPAQGVPHASEPQRGHHHAHA
jgi:hypothetical protein